MIGFFLLFWSSDRHPHLVVVKVDRYRSVVALGRTDMIPTLGAGPAAVTHRVLGQLVVGRVAVAPVAGPVVVRGVRPGGAPLDTRTVSSGAGGVTLSVVHEREHAGLVEWTR